MVITIVSDISFFLLHASNQITPDNMNKLLDAKPNMLIVETSCLSDFLLQYTYSELIFILQSAHNVCERTILINNDAGFGIEGLVAYFDQLVTAEWVPLDAYTLVDVRNSDCVYNKLYKRIYALWHRGIDIDSCVSLLVSCLYQEHFIDDRKSIDKARTVMRRRMLHNKPLVEYFGIPSQSKAVSMLLCTNRNDPLILANIEKNLSRITSPDYELILLLHNSKIPISTWANRLSKYCDIKARYVDESLILGECLNLGVSMCKNEYITKIDDDDVYFHNYLTDLTDIFDYTNADIVGKRSVYLHFAQEKRYAVDKPGLENCYVETVKGATITFRRSLFNTIQFQPRFGEDRKLCKDAMEKGLTIYAGDRYNFIVTRHAQGNERFNDEILARRCHFTNHTEQTILSDVIV